MEALAREVVGQNRNVLNHPDWNIEFHSSQKALIIVHAINQVAGKQRVGTIDRNVWSFRVKARGL